MTHPVSVPDWGDMNSRIVLVGEAPGANEVVQGKPFVGSSGLLLEQWWKQVGLVREHFYITNVSPIQPPGNNITKVGSTREESEQLLQRWAEELRARISALPDPWLIVPTGSVALRALTRAVKLLGKDPSISDWRGSIMTFTDNSGRDIKMIPTLHPAGVLRKKKLEMRCIWDWHRIVREVQFREVRRMWREHRINPDVGEVEGYFGSLPGDAPVAVDIETHPQEGITCIGFSHAVDHSFTVPFGVKRQLRVKAKGVGVSKAQKEGWMRLRGERLKVALEDQDVPFLQFCPTTKKGDVGKAVLTAIQKFRDTGKITPKLMEALNKWEEEKHLPPQPAPQKSEWDFITVGYWGSPEEDARAKTAVMEFLQGNNPKIFQNGLYDTFWLRNWMKVEVGNWAWDTLSMHHCLYPRDEHALDYMASLFTDEPFWKKEAKEAEESGKYQNRREALYTYNGKDCAVTFELFTKFHRMICEAGREEFYHRHYREMQLPLLDIMTVGIPVDRAAVDQVRGEMRERLGVLFGEIEHLAGQPLHTAKKLSPDRLKNYFYSDLRLPRKKAKRSDGEKTDTANETAIRELILQCSSAVEKWPERTVSNNYRTFLSVAKKILEANRIAKVIEQLGPKRFDPDGRFRSSYKFTTTTGRLASSKNPFGTGANAQNIDRELRHIFKASPGKLFMEIDLSQVEGRIVYMRTGDKELVRMAQTHPAEYDMHSAEASIIFNVPQREVTPDQRYLGKRTVHGAQRGLHGKRLSAMLLGEEDEDGNMTYILTPEECQRLLDAYFAGKPAIKSSYFAGVRKMIWDHRRLISLWGRVVDFPYDRWDDELYREGYSWQPQSEAADLLNQWGLIPTARYIRDNNLETRIVAQVHDALWFETTVDEGWYVAECFRGHIERPLRYGEDELVVPCTLKIGQTAKGDHEWKRFPSLEEFRERAMEVLG